MQQPGIDSDNQRSAANHLRRLVKRTACQHFAAFDRGCNPFAADALGLVTPRQHNAHALPPQSLPQSDPVGFTPFLAGARCPVQQHRVRRT